MEGMMRRPPTKISVEIKVDLAKCIQALALLFLCFLGPTIILEYPQTLSRLAGIFRWLYVLVTG
jgi:hypothetical protein